MTIEIKNPGFENWDEENHLCHVFPTEGEPHFAEINNIFVPPGWEFFLRHEPGVWDVPEGRPAFVNHDPSRVHDGKWGYMYFSFQRRHWAGLYQRVAVPLGATLEVSAQAHGWSNHNLPGHGDCRHDPRCSAGVGRGAFFCLLKDALPLNGDPWNDAVQNMAFCVGVDVYGGGDPFSENIRWGEAACIYNEYHEVPPLRVRIPEPHIKAGAGDTCMITIFLSNATLWAFENNNVYWDSVEVREVRGDPRIQYRRTYVLMPKDAGAEWAMAAMEATWDTNCFTVGGSADDAGIGDLDERNVVAINPKSWGPGDDGKGLLGFYEKHYPGVAFHAIYAVTPEQMAEALRGWSRGHPASLGDV